MSCHRLDLCAGSAEASQLSLPRCATSRGAACDCLRGSTWLFLGDSVIRGVWSRLGQWLLEGEGIDIRRDAAMEALVAPHARFTHYFTKLPLIEQWYVRHGVLATNRSAKAQMGLPDEASYAWRACGGDTRLVFKQLTKTREFAGNKAGESKATRLIQSVVASQPQGSGGVRLFLSFGLHDLDPAYGEASTDARHLALFRKSMVSVLHGLAGALQRPAAASASASGSAATAAASTSATAAATAAAAAVPPPPQQQIVWLGYHPRIEERAPAAFRHIAATSQSNRALRRLNRVAAGAARRQHAGFVDPSCLTRDAPVNSSATFDGLHFDRRTDWRKAQLLLAHACAGWRGGSER